MGRSSASPPSQRWFVPDLSDETPGLSSGQLRRLAAVGRIRPETPIRSEGQHQWRRAHQIAGLFPDAAEGQAVGVMPMRERARPEDRGDCDRAVDWYDRDPVTDPTDVDIVLDSTDDRTLPGGGTSGASGPATDSGHPLRAGRSLHPSPPVRELATGPVVDAGEVSPVTSRAMGSRNGSAAGGPGRVLVPAILVLAASLSALAALWLLSDDAADVAVAGEPAP